MPWQCQGECPGGPSPVSAEATATVEVSQAMGKSSLNGYEEVVITKNAETIVIKKVKAYIRERINVMTQALWVEDRSLPQGVTMQNGYMEQRTGSKNAIVVVRNSIAHPQTLKKKTPVAQAVAATAMSELPATTQLLEGGGTSHSSIT